MPMPAMELSWFESSAALSSQATHGLQEREGIQGPPCWFITSKEQLLPPGFRFLMQFPAEAEHDLLTPTPALPRSQGRRGLLSCRFHSGMSSVLGCTSLGDQKPGALHKGLKQSHS